MLWGSIYDFQGDEYGAGKTLAALSLRYIQVVQKERIAIDNFGRCKTDTQVNVYGTCIARSLMDRRRRIRRNP